MTKKKSAKRAFISSFMSFIMCFAMLAGTTFAWYTDSVTSSGNKIIAGTLDIELWKYEPDTSVDGRDTDGYVNISESGAPIFQSANLAQNSTATLWEPGKTQVAYLKIKNNGDLALKYSVAIDVRNIAKDLYKVMKYAIVPDATQAVGVSPWAGIPDTSVKSVVPGTNPTGFSDITMPKNAVHNFALVIHMDEEAGNEYMAGEVDFDLRVLATQETYEADSFGTDYDANAEYPPAPLLINTTASGNHDSAAQNAIVIEDVSAISTIPAETTVTTATITGGSASTGELSRTIETTPGDNSVTYDISYSYTTTTTSGTETTSTTEAVTAFSNIVVNNLNIGPNLANVTVTHSHTGSDPVPMTALASADTNAEGYYYDYVTGILTIKSMTYSDFIVSYTKKIDVSSVTVSGDATVEAGSTLALTATVLPANASYKDVAWTSSDAAVATVDANGVVTGVAVGSVTITATADGQSDTFNVTVVPGPVHVTNEAELMAALSEYNDVIIDNDFNITAGNIPLNGKTVYGNGKTLLITTQGVHGFIADNGGRIENLNIKLSRGRLTTAISSSALNSDLTLDNCGISMQAHFNGGRCLFLVCPMGSEGSLNISNCSFDSWIQYKGIKSASITDCQFIADSVYTASVPAAFEPDADSVIENCTFLNYGISLDDTIVPNPEFRIDFINCNGQSKALTAGNFLSTMALKAANNANAGANAIKAVSQVTVDGTHVAGTLTLD